MTAAPLSRRWLDYVYVGYFAIHILITLCVDLQSFYPQALIPDVLKAVSTDYLAQSGDPLMAKTLGNEVQMAWFGSFMLMEAFFQLPTFFVAIYALLKGYQSIYILLLAYGASTATTTIPCIATILAVPTTTINLPTGTVSITEDQRTFMMMNYLPFLIMPLLIAVDSAFKLATLVRRAQVVSVKGKKE